MKHQNDDNYLLLKYEDIVSKPEYEIKKICNFLEMPFEKHMLFPYGKPSSYSGEMAKGFDKSRIYTWENKLKGWERNLINLLAIKSMKEFRYNL